MQHGDGRDQEDAECGTRWNWPAANDFFPEPMSTLPSPSSRWSVEPSQLERVTAALPKEFLRRNAALAPYTTFKIGGPADLLLEATSADVLADAVMAARAARVPCFVLGLGANVLVGDLGVEGLFVVNIAARSGFVPDGRLDPAPGAGTD